MLAKNAQRVAQLPAGAPALFGAQAVHDVRGRFQARFVRFHGVLHTGQATASISGGSSNGSGTKLSSLSLSKNRSLCSLARWLAGSLCKYLDLVLFAARAALCYLSEVTAIYNYFFALIEELYRLHDENIYY